MSWLTTREYRRCLDRYYEIVNAPDEEPLSEAREWRLDYISSEVSPNPIIAKDAELIFRLMEASEDKGNSARIVFWFDN